MSRGRGIVFTDGSPELVDKKNHVRASRMTRLHHCHWPGCQVKVTPAKWGCMKHWMKLPKYLRDKVWAAYQIRQEDTQTPSREYIAVAREVQLWISCEMSGL